MTRRSFDAIIIGGGMPGCATALFLARAKWRVAVLDKDYPGRHASGVNSGGVRTLGRDLRELPLALEARRIWQDIASLVGEDCGFEAVGNVRVAENHEDFAKLQARSRAVAALGLDYREEVLDENQLRERVPGIASHCVGALAAHDDGHAQPFRTVSAFRRAAERAGARVLEGAFVLRARHSNGLWHLRNAGGDSFSAPFVVNCAGGWAGRVAGLLRDDIPLTPNGSMQLVTERLPRIVKPVVGSASRALSLKQFANGTIVIGGGQRAPVDLDTNRSELEVRGLAVAAHAASKLFPVLRSARILRAWSGIEGFTADRLPVIGTGSAPGVFHAFGFSGHGFQLGPAVGRVVAETLVSGKASSVIQAFAPGRPSLHPPSTRIQSDSR